MENVALASYIVYFSLFFFHLRNFKTQDGAMMDGVQSQRWLDDEVSLKKPRVSELRERKNSGSKRKLMDWSSLN